MELWTQVQSRIAETLGALKREAVRVPARRAACDCYLPEAPERNPEAFGTLFGAPLVAEVRKKNGRLLFTLTDAFYDACVERVNAALPLPIGDSGDLALNRLLRLARHGGEGCPRVPSVQRALWLCAGAARSSSAFNAAADAVRTMLHELPVCERQTLLQTCGAAAAACARLYARGYLPAANPKRASACAASGQERTSKKCN